MKRKASAHHARGLVALGLLLPLAVEASAQNASRHEEQKRLANANVVTIAASSASSTYTRFAEDIQNVLAIPDGTGCACCRCSVAAADRTSTTSCS